MFTPSSHHLHVSPCSNTWPRPSITSPLQRLLFKLTLSRQSSRVSNTSPGIHSNQWPLVNIQPSQGYTQRLLLHLWIIRTILITSSQRPGPVAETPLRLTPPCPPQTIWRQMSRHQIPVVGTLCINMQPTFFVFSLAFKCSYKSLYTIVIQPLYLKQNKTNNKKKQKKNKQKKQNNQTT